jgi:hypothetical protein
LFVLDGLFREFSGFQLGGMCLGNFKQVTRVENRGFKVQGFKFLIFHSFEASRYQFKVYKCLGINCEGFSFRFLRARDLEFQYFKFMRFLF